MANDTIISAKKIESKAPLKRSTVIWVVVISFGLLSIGVLLSQQSKHTLEEQPTPAKPDAVVVKGSAVQIDEELAGVAKLKAASAETRPNDSPSTSQVDPVSPSAPQSNGQIGANPKFPKGAVTSNRNESPARAPVPVPMPESGNGHIAGRTPYDRRGGQFEQSNEGDSVVEIKARGIASKTIISDESAVKRDQAVQSTASGRQQQLAELARVQAALATGQAAGSSVGVTQSAAQQGSLASNDPYLRAAMSSLQGGSKPPVDANRIWLEELSQTKSAETIRPTHIVSGRTLTQGKVIPAILLRNLNSDLPGEVVATSSVDVYDSLTGRYKLIPKGSTLIGRYASGISMGQERLMFAFTLLILPNGLSFNLPGAQGMDVGGQSGVTGEVNNHFLKMFASSFLVAFLADKAESASSRPVTSGLSAGSSGAQTAAGQVLVDTSRVVLQKYQNIPPTITIEAGMRINVQVVKDMEFPATTNSGVNE